MIHNYGRGKMGSIYLTILFLAVNVIFEATGTLSVEVPEFQYPCYVDICTFPSQFCNSDKYERRCSPCSREICRAINVPLACRYICMKHNQCKYYFCTIILYHLDLVLKSIYI